MDKDKLSIIVTESGASIEVNGDFTKAIDLLVSGILHFKNAFYDVVSRSGRDADESIKIINDMLKICSCISIDEVKGWIRENYE